MARMMEVGEAENPQGWIPLQLIVKSNLSAWEVQQFFQTADGLQSNGILNGPASVSPIFRIPLFWLSFYNFPLWLYITVLTLTIGFDRYVNIYFHPCEFADLSIQNTISQLHCQELRRQDDGRFSELIYWMKEKGYYFVTLKHFASRRHPSIF